MPNNKKLSSLKVETKNATDEELNVIPISSSFNYDELTKDYEDKIEVIAEIPVSTSKRNWDYTENAIKDVVKDVNEGKVVGFKGHQKPDNISTEFPDIKTVWLGAVYDEDNKVAKVRGLMDKHDTQLNNWVKNGLINTVSIFGKPKLKKEKGRTKVDGYKTMSIDWTPRNRAGMPTTVKVASGEMEVINDTFFGELDGSYEELNKELNLSVKNYFGSNDNNNIYVWIKKTFSDYLICQVDNNNNNTLQKVYYEEKDDTINIISSEEVKEEISYIAIGEIENKEEGSGEMPNNKNVLPDEYKNVLGEMSADELKNTLDKFKKLQEEESKKLHGEMVDKCLVSKIENEKIRNVVKTLSKFEGTTEELINGEIDSILNTDVIKNMLNTEYKGINENNDNDKSNNFKGLKRA